MFVFLWLCIICSVLWLSHCVTVKPANQLNLQVEGQWETSLLRRGPAWWKNTALVPCLRTSQWIPQVFPRFPHFLRFPPPQGYTGGAASPLSGPTSCFVKSHPRCTSVLTSLPARISTNGWVGSQRTLLTKMFCIKDLRFVCNSRPYCVPATRTLNSRSHYNPIFHIGYLNLGIKN